MENDINPQDSTEPKPPKNPPSTVGNDFKPLPQTGNQESVVQPQEDKLIEKPVTTQPQDTEPKRKKNSKKWLWIALVVLLLLSAGAAAWWYINREESTASEEQTETTQEITETQQELEQFNNVLTYAYYENGVTLVKSVDLDDNPQEKKTILEFGEESDIYSEDGQYSAIGEAPVSISEDGKKLLYANKDGLYELEIETDNRTRIFEFTYKNRGTAGESLDEVIVVKNGENIRNPENPDFGFLQFGRPLYSYWKNGFGYTERHYEGISVAVFDRDTDSTVDIGDTFRYIPGALDGELAFTLNSEAIELKDYGLYPEHLFDVTGGVMEESVFNPDKSIVATTIHLADDNSSGANYDSALLAVVNTNTGEHKIITETGPYSYNKVYQSNGNLTIIDIRSNKYTLKQYDESLGEVKNQDLADISGYEGDIVDTDLQLINDKVYIEITTKVDDQFRTYVYNYDDKEFIREFLVAEDADVMVLSHR